MYLKTHTTFSLRKSIIKPKELVSTVKNYGASCLAITEKGNIFSYVKIFSECKEAKIKPIIGIDLYIRDNEQLSNLTLLCKNKAGFLDLLKIISTSNLSTNFNYDKEIPTISLADLANLSTSKNFIAYAGCLNSLLSIKITDKYYDFLKSKTYEEAKSLVSPLWKENLDSTIAKLQEIFGKDNFFLEIQKTDIDKIPASNIVFKIMADASKRLRIPAIATCKPHYLHKNDASVHKVLICIDKKTSMDYLEHVLENEQDTEYHSFLRSDEAYLLSPNEFEKLYEKEYLENNKLVESLCENYDVFSLPKIPKFDCPNNLDSLTYLTQLCKNSWGKIPVDKNSIYEERFKYEMKVIQDVGLASYFLVLWDIFNYARSNNWLSAVRGSAGGSIITYLLGLSEADPVKYNLVFSRFYNEGRNQPGKISLPDIDADFPIQHRPQVISYIRNKYGHENVGNIATFGSLKGASSLKEILRVTNACSADEANQITKLIIDEHKISDELEELRKSGEEATILGWSIENVNALHDYVNYDDNGNLVGDYAFHFGQAIKLEGCKRNLSKHACGIVVSTEKLNTFCPMVQDKNSGDLMVGLEMSDVESIGGMKLDCLGVASLTDVMETISLVRNGDLVRNT